MNYASRREFLKNGVTAGTLAASSVWASPLLFGQSGNDGPTVAAIGVGGSRSTHKRGTDIAMKAAGFGRFIAVCDVDEMHNREFNQRFDDKLATYTDHRKLLEKEKPAVVTIGTPDHWHVPIAIDALRAGCDVYCEKPLTLTIEEGIRIRKVVQETGRVFQVGTQQRSEFALRFLKAVAMVRSGRLGNQVNAFLAIGSAPGDGPFATAAPPEDLDWDRWVGPAPKAEYSDERRKFFRWYFEYSGGKMTDWGAHHIDIAQWALGCDHTGPTKVRSVGKFPSIVSNDVDWDAFLEGKSALPNGYNTATEFGIDLEFLNGAKISVNHFYQRDERTKFPNGILFEGEKGRIFVNRERLVGQPIENLTEADHADLAQWVTKLYKGKQPGDHMGNFFDCLADRSVPISDVETHHRTMTSCHLCNISLMLGRDLEWDPNKEQFVGDDQANSLVSRHSRSGFAA